MKYRIADIFAPKDLGASGTEVIDIKLKDCISRIDIQYKFTTPASAASMSAPPCACLPKIELVDGSSILHSLSGYEEQALNLFNRGKMPRQYVNLAASTVNIFKCGIDFGCFLFDQQLAFDPKKYKNPQLKIQYNETNCIAGSDAGTLEVIAWVFDEKVPSPVGFLLSKEIYSYTPAASAHEYVDLPTDLLTRALLIRALTTDVDIVTQMDTLKLSEDNDKRIPIEQTFQNLLEQNIENYGELIEDITLDASVTARNLYIIPTYEVVAASFNTGAYDAADADVGAITITANKAALGANVTVLHQNAKIKGYAPHSSIFIPFGKQMEIEDWYDVTKLGSLRADILATSDDQTNAAAYIVTQQLQKY